MSSHRSGVSTLRLQVAVRSKSLSLAHSLWWFYYSRFFVFNKVKNAPTDYGQRGFSVVKCLQMLI